MKNLFKLMFIITLSIFFISCDKDEKEVKVGVLLPLTGPQSITGLKIRNGYQFAADEINSSGGIKSLGGIKIKLFYGDTEGSPKIGKSETQRLIEQIRVSVIMGCFQSSVAMPTTQEAERLKTPYIVGNPMADEVTERGFKYIFRITAKSSWMARDQMRFIKEIGDKAGNHASSIVLLYEDTDFGQSTAKAQRAYAKNFGYEIVSDLPYPHQTSDISSTILRIKEADPDVILATSYDTDAVLIIKTMKELNYKPKFGYIGSTGGYINPHFITAAGELSEGILTSNLWNFDIKKSGARKFYEQYKARFKEDPVPQCAIAYAAMFVFKGALERCKTTRKDDIRKALAETEISDGPVEILPYNKIHFDNTGQNKDVSLIMVQILGGEFVTVWPFDVARKDVIWPLN